MSCFGDSTKRERKTRSHVPLARAQIRYKREKEQAKGDKKDERKKAGPARSNSGYTGERRRWT